MLDIKRTTLDYDACLPILGDMSCFLGEGSSITISDHTVDGVVRYTFVILYWDYVGVEEIGGVDEILERVIKFFKPHDAFNKPSPQNVTVLTDGQTIKFEQMYEIVGWRNEQ